MKSLLVASILFITTTIFSQSNINFIDSTYEHALSQARLAKKPLFILLYDLQCSHCENMRKNVLTQQTVVDFFNTNFVSYQLDGMSEAGRLFAIKNQVGSFPTFLFKDSAEVNIINFTGEMPASEFIDEAKNALIPTKYHPYLRDNFLKDTTNGVNCLAYLNAIKRSNQKGELDAVAKKYLATQTDEQLLSMLNWKVMAIGVNEIQSKEFEFILTHKTEFIQLTSAKRFEIKAKSIAQKGMKYAVDFNTPEAFAKNRELVQRIGLRATDSILFVHELMYYEKNNLWKDYKASVDKGVTNFAWNTPKLLNEIGSNYYKHLATKENLNKAITYVKRSNELGNTYNSNYLIAKLYKKNNDLVNAKVYAKRAFAVAEEKKIDKTEILKLYKELQLK